MEANQLEVMRRFRQRSHQLQTDGALDDVAHKHKLKFFDAMNAMNNNNYYNTRTIYLDSVVIIHTLWYHCVHIGLGVEWATSFF